MIRIGATYECDRCGHRQYVDPTEFRWHRQGPGPPTTEALLVGQYGWKVMWEDVHHCRRCVDKAQG